MPAREQLLEAIADLRRAGGDKVFIEDRRPPGLEALLAAEGLRLVREWRVDAWPSDVLSEYRLLRPAGDRHATRG
jgi:hypothetical protein